MSHTGTQLRIAASGPGASRVDGLTDQTDNFYTIAGALGLATDTTSQNNLSNGGKVTVNKDKDGKKDKDKKDKDKKPKEGKKEKKGGEKA